VKIALIPAGPINTSRLGRRRPRRAKIEHDVDVERVREFKRVSHAAVMAMAEAIGDALPGLGAAAPSTS
jgi:hypothetical protein